MNLERLVLEYSGLLESCSTVVELLYCTFFERYGLDVMVPVVLWKSFRTVCFRKVWATGRRSGTRY